MLLNTKTGGQAVEIRETIGDEKAKPEALEDFVETRGNRWPVDGVATINGGSSTVASSTVGSRQGLMVSSIACTAHAGRLFGGGDCLSLPSDDSLSSATLSYRGYIPAFLLSISHSPSHQLPPFLHPMTTRKLSFMSSKNGVHIFERSYNYIAKIVTAIFWRILYKIRKTNIDVVCFESHFYIKLYQFF